MGEVEPKEAIHPSPHRGRVGLSALMFGLAAAPLAWGAQSVINASLAYKSCYPGTTPLLTAAGPSVQVWLIGLNLAALLVCGAGAAIAWGVFRRTRHEHPGGSQTLMEVGEGRSRFMALCGLITSLGFLLATLFCLPGIALIPLC